MKHYFTYAYISECQFFRFLIVGLSNTLISFLIFFLIFNILPDIPGMASLSQGGSYCAGILWSYFWNRRWVFKSNKKILGEGGRFLFTQVILLVISSVSVGAMVDFLHFYYIISWVVVMVFITIFNYLLLKVWTFR